MPGSAATKPLVSEKNQTFASLKMTGPFFFGYLKVME